MPPTTHLRERQRLAEALRSLREETGLSGRQFAQRLGWIQTRVSKIETGKQFPTRADIQEWASVGGARPEVVRELLSRLAAARTEYATWQENYRRAGGAARKQADIAAMEAQSARIGKYQPAMIPSQLQTIGYARELLRLPSGPSAWGATETEIDEMVATRMRRQEILYQPGKQIQLVVLEAALRTRFCASATMAGQLDRLLALDGLPSLEFNVIPFGTLVPVYPVSGFVVYDDHLVIVESLGGEQHLSDPGDISRYAGWLDLLRQAAVRGRAAVPLIRAALAELGTD